MRISFGQRIWRELLGPMSMSAVLKAHGHSTTAAVADDVERLARALTLQRPDVVALTWGADDHAFLGALVSHLRALSPRARVIVGGPLATHAPDLVFAAGPDALCVGEGELALLDYVEALQAGGDGAGVANLWVRRGDAIVKSPVRPLVADLDALPDPDRALYAAYPLIHQNPQASVMATRGCPYSCTFCASPALRRLYRGLGPAVRRRSAERVVAEIAAIASERDLRMVRFEDDTLALDRAWLRALLEGLRDRVGVPYVCYLRADQVDPPLATLLRETGCHFVCFGVETGDERRRVELLGKGILDRHLLEAARVLHDHGVRFYTTNMLGLPGETLADAWKTVELNQRLAPDDAWCSIFQPYPGLPITDEALRQGLIAPADVTQPGTRPFDRNALANRDARAIFNLHKLFLPAVRLPALRPFLERWIRAPTGALNQPVFLAGMAWAYGQRSRVGPWRLLREGAHWLRFFAGRRS